MSRDVTRRELLAVGALGSAALGTSALLSNSLIARALANPPACGQPSATDSRVTMSSCAASAPLDLATDSTNSLKAIEETVVPACPVTVNRRAPPQERGSAGAERARALHALRSQVRCPR
jgi:hypothetical protein